jgi:hypothetical protein
MSSAALGRPEIPQPNPAGFQHTPAPPSTKVDFASGTYDERGHSPLYGFGRPDVARAVELARERQRTARA